MKNRFVKIVAVVCLMVLFGMLLVACDDDNAKMRRAVNRHLKTHDAKILYDFGSYYGTSVVWVESKAIEYEYRKDTINGIQLKYTRGRQILAIYEDNAYALKDAFLNLLLDSAALKEIKQTFEQEFEPARYVYYFEIGEEIVLENKSLFDVRELEYYPEDYMHDIVVIGIDRNFKRKFEFSDFLKFCPTLDASSMSWSTEYYEELFGDPYPEKYHHYYRIYLNDSGIDELLHAIDLLKNLDFVNSAWADTIVSFV